MRGKSGLLLVILLLAFTNMPTKTRPPSRLAFASDRAGNGDIFMMDEWGGLTNLTNSLAGEWDPQWSPDGSLLAFTSHQQDQADIWTMTLDDHTQTNITDHPAWDYAPAWSPDGNSVVFVSERDGDAELFSQSILGGPAVQLTRNDHLDKHPSWSPDGRLIAFTTVANDHEQVYLLDLQRDNQIRPLITQTGFSSTSPVWSPDGNSIALIGWEDTDAISIYLFDMDTETLSQHYTTDRWIGSLSWSADERWLFFTSRQQDNHDLSALNLQTGQVLPLTQHTAWDDFPSAHPALPFFPAQTGEPVPPPFHGNAAFAYGVNLADLSNAKLIRDIGFTHIKGFVNWGTVETSAGTYRWSDPDNVIEAAAGSHAQVLLRVHGTPAWAKPADTALSHPPSDLGDFARFMRALATRYKGQVAAYEIWNEPNLNYEWGYQPPDPAAYVAMLKTAYQAIKSVDPEALVISGGLAPTGEGNLPEAMGELAFLQGMYQAGAKGYFDALGSHPYSYGHSPDFVSPTDITFDRVIDQRQIMQAYEDDQTPIWITEMGWVLDTHWDLGIYHNQGITQQTQAVYIKRAFEKIETEWPWVEAAFLFNLDFSTAPWYAASEQMRWYAILNPDRTPRPAYTALREYMQNRTCKTATGYLNESCH